MLIGICLVLLEGSLYLLALLRKSFLLSLKLGNIAFVIGCSCKARYCGNDITPRSYKCAETY